MANTQWRDELATGFESIDNDHKKILAKLAELLSVRKSEDEDFDVCAAIEALENYVFKHFQEEEKLMLDSKYPEAYSVIAEHSKLKEYLASIKQDIQEKGSDPEMIEVSSQLLASSIVEHIESCDCPLMAYLKVFRENPSVALVQPEA